MARRPSIVVMVPPDGFQYNMETAHSNSFQSNLVISDIRTKAMTEFNTMVGSLRARGVEVLILKQDQTLPDAVFPNNWFSTHQDAAGNRHLMLYPMLTTNRQAEVNLPGLQTLLADVGIDVDKVIDLRTDATGILEGTGSLVLDRESKRLYACLSERSSHEMINAAAEMLGYTPIVFHSSDHQNRTIYHTNVIMGIAQDYVVVCLEVIKDDADKKRILESFAITNKIVIEISEDQMNHMCGNVFELFDPSGASLLLLSAQAQAHFTTKQLDTIQQCSSLLPVTIATIEAIGGGSARCMIAEIV